MNSQQRSAYWRTNLKYLSILLSTPAPPAHIQDLVEDIRVPCTDTIKV
ncbi:MAG: hypothetical protein HOE90_18190 [Bacteriovoracaceae bacterium]|nr:hypothetical protein [Bacteriovoracaceae bacterium]